MLDTAVTKMQKLIGASLSEPHINGTAVRELYIIMVRRSREIYGLHSSMDISAKYCIVHSRAWAMGRMYAVLIYRIANLHSCLVRSTCQRR